MHMKVVLKISSPCYIKKKNPISLNGLYRQMSAGILSSGFIFNFTGLLRIQAYFDDTLTVMWQNIVSDIHIQGQQWKKNRRRKEKGKKEASSL